MRAHIDNRRAVRAVLQGVGNEVTLRTGQPNYLYLTGQGQSAAQPETLKPTPAVATAAAIPAGGDPAQYALAKLRIGEAHTLAKGDTMVVAVIDSGIDLGHPELAGVVAGSFDALGKAEKPHQHGTAIAGAIAAHARLMGAAPAAKSSPSAHSAPRAQAPKRPPWRSSRASNTPRCSGRASST